MPRYDDLGRDQVRSHKRDRGRPLAGLDAGDDHQEPGGGRDDGGIAGDKLTATDGP